MKKADLRQAIVLVRAYSNALNESAACEEFHNFYNFVGERENRTFERGLIVSVLFDGTNMGLSEETIIEMLEIAGLCEKEDE